MARRSPADVARGFVSTATAALNNAFNDAFRDGVMAAVDELGRPVNVESILASSGSARLRTLGFYMPAIAKMAGELVAISNTYRAQESRYRDDPARLADIRARFRTLFEKKRRDLNRRIALMAEGLIWASSELGYAAVAEAAGAQIWWVLDAAAEHCAGCEVLEANSPYRSVDEIGGVPGTGVSPCGAKCRCSLWIE